MALSFRFGKFRILLPLILLVMILMRLIWVNLRYYHPNYTPASHLAIEMLHYHQDDAPCPRQLMEAVGGIDIAGHQQLLTADLVPAAGALLSPGIYQGLAWLCQRPEFESGINFTMVVKSNLWLLLSTVFLAIILGRFLTSSWNLGLIAGVVLLSRGRFLSEIGEIGYSMPTIFAVMLWFVSFVHHLRTGSWVAATGVVGATLMGVWFELAFVGFAMAPALLVGFVLAARRWLLKPSLQRLREQRWRMESMGQGPLPPSIAGRLALTFQWLLGPLRTEAETHRAWQPNTKPGVVFRTLDVAYMLWLNKDQRGYRHLYLWLAAVGGVALIALVMHSSVAHYMAAKPLELMLQNYWQNLGQVLMQFAGHIDVHYGVSLLVLLVCASQFPGDGLVSFQEAVWGLLAALVTVLVLAAILEFYRQGAILQLHDSTADDTFTLSSIGQMIAHWFEPLVLTVGVAGVYQLIKVGDTHRLRRLRRGQM